MITQIRYQPVWPGCLAFHPIILNQTLNWRHAGSCSSSLLDFHKLSQVYTESDCQKRSRTHGPRGIMLFITTSRVPSTFVFDLEKKGWNKFTWFEHEKLISVRNETFLEIIRLLKITTWYGHFGLIPAHLKQGMTGWRYTCEQMGIISSWF